MPPIHIDFKFVPLESLEHENRDQAPIIAPDYLDEDAWEELIHDMPQAFLEILVCRYLGMTTKEIVKALHYPTTSQYYNVNAKMRKFYHDKQKQRLLAYN